MTGEQLLTISTFARAVGIPASALRHYAAQNVLEPAEIDTSSGYRYYSTAQIRGGELVRSMRSAGLPLEVMRHVLLEAPETAAAILESWISAEDQKSRHATAQLREVIEDLSAPSSGSGRVEVVGAHLSAALLQVAAAAETAEDSVSGVVWDIGPGGLELIATDRYWLAHRHVRCHGGDSTGRAIITPEAATVIAECCRTELEVLINIDQGELQVRGRSGASILRVPSVLRDVPDLRRLVSTQPEPSIIAGFGRTPILRILDSADGDHLAHIILDLDGASISAGHRLDGWSSPNSGDETPPSITLDPRLFAAAIRAVADEEVLLGLVDGETPVRIQSPSQDSFTALVMPYRP